MKFDNVMKLLQHLDGQEYELFKTVLTEFCNECLLDDLSSFDALNMMSLKDFTELVGKDNFNTVIVCAVEFFLSNEYSVDGKSWNAIDFLLQKKDIRLSPADRAYLEGLKNSYMGLYEVTDVVANKTITLREVLEPKNRPIVVKEKSATHCVSLSTLLGARIVNVGKNNLLAGGCFLLSPTVAKEAGENIKAISGVMMQKDKLRLYQDFTKDPVLMVKKMFVKELAQAWLLGAMAENAADAQTDDEEGIENEEGTEEGIKPPLTHHKRGHTIH